MKNNPTSLVTPKTLPIDQTPKSSLKPVWALSVLLFIASFAGTYFYFSPTSTQIKIADSPAEVTGARRRLNTDLPKTEACPINGMMYPKPVREIWEGRRPITAIVENHLDSRPQSGLSKADVVYEAVAEGGITRFLGVFYCNVASEDVRIGPVRSARVYFAKWAYEYGLNPIFVHVGGANNICGNCPGGVKPVGTVTREVDAFRLLSDWGWRAAKGNTMDGGTNVGVPTMWRDAERIPGAAYEHTFMASTDLLFDEAKKRGFGATDEKGVSWSSTFKPWKFADSLTIAGVPATSVSYSFWKNKPDYDVSWRFDSELGKYLRSHGDKPHLDMDYEDTQISAKNLIIQYVVEKGPVDKEYHMYYENLGTGKAMFFVDGKMVEGTWRRAKLTDRTVFFDSKGQEFPIVRGEVWISALPIGNEVLYQ